ncbi:ciliary microtubule-associated protein 3 [Aplochiton taeniatus]
MAVRESAPNRCVVFGSCQERKLFPSDYAPNRLGNEQPRQGSPRRGPGCYDNHLVSFITVTPSPQKYQKDNTWSEVPQAGKIPFSSITQRFREKSVTTDNNPGPGAYAHETTRNRQVTWPMVFGSPDWDKLPQLERKALRTELPCDKEFRKQRKRVAYMSLFYS